MAPDTCSAKGCTVAATWQLLWNNPKLHTPERRKVWLACDTHRPTLSDFLAARSFLRDVVPHDAAAAEAAQAAAAAGSNVDSAADR